MLSLKKAGVSGIEDHMRPKSVLKLTGLSGARVPMGEKTAYTAWTPFPFSLYCSAWEVTGSKF